MSCPECYSEDFESELKDDGQGYKTWEYYTCGNCGCEWQWVSEKTITKHGKFEIDFEFEEDSNENLLPTKTDSN